MSSQYIQRALPAMAPSAPRLGTLRDVMGQRLAAIGRAIWRFLEAWGEQRASRELLTLADRWQAQNPTLARELRSYARGGSSY